MAKERFRSINFRYETREKIDHMNLIIEEYDGQKLTARQLYYRFVAADLIPNSDKSYKNFTGLLADARYAGLVDWDAIEDRGREPDLPSDWGSIDRLVDAAIRQFRLPRWAGQKYVVELWVEKQALAGVLEPIARKWHVALMVNKGYSSASAMKEAAVRLSTACGYDAFEEKLRDEDLDQLDENEREERVQKLAKEMHESCAVPRVIYLGDHDPSGEDMVRDIEARLTEFNVYNVQVFKAALTMKQIKEFNPPPNPAKITDSRARKYIEKFGSHSWELDALPPKELNRIVEESIRKVIDIDAYNAVIAEEELQRSRLNKAMKGMRSK